MVCIVVFWVAVGSCLGFSLPAVGDLLQPCYLWATEKVKPTSLCFPPSQVKEWRQGLCDKATASCFLAASRGSAGVWELSPPVVTSCGGSTNKRQGLNNVGSIVVSLTVQWMDSVSARTILTRVISGSASIDDRLQLLGKAWETGFVPLKPTLDLFFFSFRGGEAKPPSLCRKKHLQESGNDQMSQIYNN